MLIEYLTTNPQFYFAVIIVVTVSICLHELAHGFTAMAFGDRTPEETGHITLNPLVHMGPMSLLMLVLVGISWGAMPVNPSRMRGRYADAVVSFAGPATNLVLAFLGMTGLGLWLRWGTFDPDNHMVQNAYVLLRVMGIFNLVLFALNLIPVPPLDGSRILANFSSGYRNLIYSPTAAGAMLAIMFAVLIGAGRFLVPWADDLFTRYTSFVAGA